MSARRRFLQYWARYRNQLAVGTLCIVGSVAFSMARPIVIGNVVNELGSGSLGRATLMGYGLVLITLATVQGVFSSLYQRIILGASRRIEHDMRNDFYMHLQSLPLRFYEERRTGDLMSRATNDFIAARMLISAAVHSVSSLLMVVIAFIMMLHIDVHIALIALVAVAIVPALVRYFGSRIHDRSRAVQDYFGEISARAHENLTGARVVRAFTREADEMAAFDRMSREYIARNRSLIGLTGVFYPSLQTVIGMVFVVLFYLGSRRILAGTMTLGSFVELQFYLFHMMFPLVALGWVFNLYHRGMAGLERLHEVWSVAPAVEIAEPVREAPRGDLEIRALTFSYDGYQPVLRDIDLSVRRGETVGIVGRPGSGKSTLLALIVRAYEPPPGTILLDGRPIETVPLRQLRGWIGMVPQETFLFSASIAENIRFGRTEATDEDVRAAAADAGLSTDIAALPKGIDTLVGERGITLSGGQKQRTAIARALVGDPLILLLDDASSAVDTETEERLLAALRRTRRERCTVVVSHRVSSVKDADQIIVLEEGRIVERGTHEALLERGGYYATLHRLQKIAAELGQIG